MKSEILDFFKKELCIGVTFAELVAFFGDKIAGDYAWIIEPNMVLWMGLSEDFLDAMGALVKEGQLEIKPATPLVYIMDGLCLTLPLVKGNYRYKKPHWFPVCFSLVKTDGLEKETKGKMVRLAKGP